MKGFSLRFFFPSQTEWHSSVPDMIFLEPCPTEGPEKSLPSVCLSISISEFLSGMGCYFFQIFCTMVEIWNISKLTEPFFPGKFIFPQIWAKISNFMNNTQNNFNILFHIFFA